MEMYCAVAPTHHPCGRRTANLPSAHPRSGFTLIEFLIVLAVFAVLVALAVPRIDIALRASQGRSAVTEFTAAHFLARTSAMRYGRPAELHIDAGSKRFWVVVDTTVAGGTTDTVGTVHTLTYGNMTMTSTRSYLCFDRRGLAWAVSPCEAGDVTVTFTQGSRVDSVTTTVLGKIVR